jgi:hypothetical protein
MDETVVSVTCNFGGRGGTVEQYIHYLNYFIDIILTISTFQA